MPLLFLIFILFAPQLVYSEESPPTIVINEFQIEPQQQVELLNRSQSTIDLSGWYIDDDGGSTFFTVPAGTVVEPNHCVVLSGSFNLNKSSQDTIKLFNKTAEPISTAAQLIDSYIYNRSQGDFISFQRIPDGGVWATGSATLGLWNISGEKCTVEPTSTPSPTTTTVTPTPRISPTTPPDITTNIYISEFYPAPLSGEKEWVEIYNNNDFEVTLTNWYIDDIENAGASPKVFTSTISPKGYTVIELSTGILNNAGDSVRILNSQKKAIDEISYDDADSGLSIGWTEVLSSQYCQQEPTEGDANSRCIQFEVVQDTSESEINTSVLGTSHDTPHSQVESQTSPFTHFLIPALIPESQQISTHLNTSQPTLTDPDSHVTPFPFSSIALLSIFSIAAKMKLQL